ncbi:14 kDa proline-rich protein DC2.15-like [Durio zibethinus]|uniref:14 kDa proline-rich protein DC2.15-like n=1 Tax=Durio zibethinus TaxID=66656 RepID=A0A6P6A3D9_DURZI|nr:14 kDa proline-rich protein DC2.15-like [Durio zibethinus]
MASKAVATTSLFLSLNLLFFTMVSSTSVPCPPDQPKIPKNPPQNPPATRPPSTNPPANTPSCPRDTLKLGVCANLLNDLVHVVIGTPPKTPCCTLIQGLADLEAAVCLCTAIKANILGINLNVPISLSLLLNYCGKNVPRGFQCA